MAQISKYIKVHPSVLLQWTFDNENNITENYQVITNLGENKKRSFLSTTGLNVMADNLFQIDPVLKKYAVVNPKKFNFLQEQDYSTPPIPYDKVRIYLPTSYDFQFNNYIGFYLKVFTYGYGNNTIYDLSNIFYDDSNPTSLLNLAIPFIYDEQEWGKYFEFQIPSINFISNQRIMSNVTNVTIPNSLNANLTLNEGLSQTSPIFVDFQFIMNKETVLGTTYYYNTESNKTSFAKAPEYDTLAVQIVEATDGDFFEIYGTYGESNENLQTFVNEVETKGRRIRIEYDIYLYEENIQTNKQTIVVTGGPTDDFTKKIYYRPIITFANTTAAIKVEMRVIDLIDMSTISRYATYGITTHIQKYGKKLVSLNISNINKLKIYNAKPEQIILKNDATNNIRTEIVKVKYPQLIEVGKVVVNSPKSVNGYRGMGLLNVVITPFDNILQFRIGTLSTSNQLEIYNLSAILQNSDLLLIFKSDSESIEKSIYQESTNDYEHGIINYKINENDLSVLKKIYDKGYTNFYLTLSSNNIKTLLYSGTYSFFEDIKFLDDNVNIPDQSLKEPNTTPVTENINPQTWNPSTGKTVIIYVKYKNSTIVSNTTSNTSSA